MKFRLGQKVRYKRIVRKIQSPFMEEKDFEDGEIIEKERIKTIELTKERHGFVMGERHLAERAQYTFEEDNSSFSGHVAHYGTETIRVYKIAYDMAHTNYVLEEDLKEATNVS